MDSSWKWKNPYIDLVRTKPGLIGCLAPDESPAELSAQLAQKRGQFTALFVELGSGSGGHLVELAETHPHALCLGFELRFKRVFRTAEKSERLGQKNLMVLHCDARRLADILPTGSVDRFYVNFPDPWDKRIWKKHRLMQAPFIETLHTQLTPTGSLRYKTDHQEYFSAAVQEFSTSGNWSVPRLTTSLHESTFAQDNIQTEFEKLFLCQGKPICFAEFFKNPSN